MKESHDIVDIGVNLAHRSFQADRKQIVERAFAVGVRTMVITGTSVVGSQEGVRIAREYPGQLFVTAGVHPHDSRNCTEATISKLRRLATHREVVAIGECGLDFNRDFSPRPQQEKWYGAQVALAEELQKPLFLHERDARQRFCEILAAVRKIVPAVLHCFTGTREELKIYLDMGLHLGITGWICDERRGTHLRELVREIPLDRLTRMFHTGRARRGLRALPYSLSPFQSECETCGLMIETDAPFLVPRTMPTKPKDGRNEPAFLPYVLQAVADCLGKPVPAVAEATTKTAREFFRL